MPHRRYSSYRVTIHIRQSIKRLRGSPRACVSRDFHAIAAGVDCLDYLNGRQYTCTGRDEVSVVDQFFP